MLKGRSSRRARLLLACFALMGGVALLPVRWLTSQAEELIDMTLLFHGSVQGKIAPCG